MTAASSPTRAPAESLRQAQAAFRPVPGYLNAATMGLPPVPVVEAMQDALGQWQTGRADAPQYDAYVTAARERYGHLVGVPTAWVATGSQTSVFAGTVAASLPDGSEVLLVEDDFTSMVFPFLVQAQRRDVTVRQVPREQLAEAITDRTTLVAFSLVQSADGSLCDGPAITGAARAHGALTFCDLTQAAGWLPVDAGDYDLTVCAAYKWLCHPRGTAYLTVRPEVAERLVPVNAGWYAGDSIWDSCYGPQMRLAADARQFDVSPAWLCWVGAVPALEVLTSAPAGAIRDHDVALADALRARMGVEPQGRPVVTVADPHGELARRLGRRGVVAASRAGRVRLSFHLWNTAEDVELVAGAMP